MNIVEIENKYTSGVYAKKTLTIVRGQGASLFDVEGREYIDCESGHGVANLGHAHPKIAEALYERYPMLAETRRSLARTLSGGQRQMLAMAMGLMTEPKLIVRGDVKEIAV